MKNPNVLLVDDDQDYAGAIKTALESDGFNVTHAKDGAAGLKQAKKMLPDLVILDVMMPKQDGYSVCHELKDDEKTSKIPVIMLTSLGKDAEGKNAAQALANGHGADGFLEKPVEPQTLVTMAKDLVEKSKAQKVIPSKILIIDDDPDFISALKMTVEEAGYQTAIAYSGEEGLLAVNRENPDLILLDVMLPEKDGFAVCKDIKENKDTRSIPVVMLTSVGQSLTEPSYAQAMAVTHKADDYIEKPVEAKELLKRIQKLIGPQRRLV